MKHYYRNSAIIILFIVYVSMCTTLCFAGETVIAINCGNTISKINKKVFGNNFIGYDPTTYERRAKPYYGYSDYGAGIWDPKRKKSVKEVIDLAKEAGITVIRFPGGCGTHHYNWKQAVGKNRKDFLYGIDEFLKTCEEIGAEAVMTVSYFTGGEKDAADLVEYLNGTPEESGEGSRNWAKVRALNGHPEPYGVKYFEIGNEVYHGDHRSIKKVLPEEYARKYLKYYKAMKAVDPAIKIGAVLHTKKWNENVLKLIKNKIDFGILHVYPSPAWRERLDHIPPDDIFGITLAQPEFKLKVYIRNALDIMEQYTGKQIPLAITEFNCGFVQEKPVPYRHTLGCALVDAELLKIFMWPKNNILMANYWNFVNEYFGIIANGFNGKYGDLNNWYYKRPNYYVFEFYNKYFGNELVDIEVQCKGYNLGEYEKYLQGKYFNNLNGEVEGEDLIEDITWEIADIEGVKIKKKEVLEIEFKNPKQFNYFHVSKACKAEPDTYYKISGHIKAGGLEVNEEESGFRLEVQDKRGWATTKWAKATKDVKGTTDWVYVERVFKTLPDAEGLTIIARRIGEKPPLKGKVFIKDVKLHKFIPEDYIVPYLSVNASKSGDGKKVYLMVINKNLKEAIETEIVLNDFVPDGVANTYTLWGKRVDATNEKRPHNDVRVYENKIKFTGNSFKVNFKKHSLTAIEIAGS